MVLTCEEADHTSYPRESGDINREQKERHKSLTGLFKLLKLPTRETCSSPDALTFPASVPEYAKHVIGRHVKINVPQRKPLTWKHPAQTGG